MRVLCFYTRLCNALSLDRPFHKLEGLMAKFGGHFYFYQGHLYYLDTCTWYAQSVNGELRNIYI